MFGRLCCVYLFAVALGASESIVPDWPHFWGPNNNRSVTAGIALLDGWGAEGPPVAWVATLPGLPAKDGYCSSASPIVVDGRVYFYSIIVPPEEIERYKNLDPQDPQALFGKKHSAKSRRLAFACLDATTGKQIWLAQYPTQERGWVSSSSPCYDEGRLYVHTSPGGLVCIDAADGRMLWSHGPWDGARGGYGSHASLMATQGKVIVNAQVVLDGKTGKPVTKLGRRSNWKPTEKTLIPTAAGMHFFAAGAIYELDSGGQILDGRSIGFRNRDRAAHAPGWLSVIGGFASKKGKYTAEVRGFRLQDGQATKVWSHAVYGGTHAVVTDGSSTWLAAKTKAEKISRTARITDAALQSELRSYKSGVLCIDNATGAIRWNREDIGSASYEQAIVADGRFFCKANRPLALFMLDAASGEMLGKPALSVFEGKTYGLECGHCPAYWNGRIYCRGNVRSTGKKSRSPGWQGMSLLCFDMRKP